MHHRPQEEIKGCVPTISRAHSATVHLQRLQDELREFIRKLDYRFGREAYGCEADAWRRVVALYVGMRGRREVRALPAGEGTGAVNAVLWWTAVSR